MALLSAVVAWSLRNRIIVLVATALFVAVGIRAATQLPIDVVPDVTKTSRCRSSPPPRPCPPSRPSST